MTTTIVAAGAKAPVTTTTGVARGKTHVTTTMIVEAGAAAAATTTTGGVRVDGSAIPKAMSKQPVADGTTQITGAAAGSAIQKVTRKHPGAVGTSDAATTMTTIMIAVAAVRVQDAADLCR